MILDDVTSFWWENITGPQMLIEQIAACLSDGKSVVLRIDGTLPWQEQMRDFTAHRLAETRFQLLDLSGVSRLEEIVPALLRRFHPSGLAVCPANYANQLEYLKNERVFANCVTWIAPCGQEGLSALLRFLSDYRGKGLAQHGAFVAEVPRGQALPRLSDRTAAIDCADHIRYGDLLLYANILSDGARQIPAEMRSYAACVTASLAGQDAELIPEILQEADLQQEDPGEVLIRMAEEGRVLCQEPPDRQELSVRVWQAQLQSVFALIEMERLRIAGDYAELIEAALDTEYWDAKRGVTGFISQHGDDLRDASDVELGTLVRMMALRRSDDRTEPLLSFPDPDLRDQIVFLKDCRNALAHHRTCTPAQMCRLLRLTART